MFGVLSGRIRVLECFVCVCIGMCLNVCVCVCKSLEVRVFGRFYM